MIRAVIFDLDGTLIHTLPDIGGSMNRTLARFGLQQHPLDAYRTMVGNGAWNLTLRAVGERRDMADRVYEAYRAEYAVHACDASHPYPGIPELLNALTDRGIRAAVFSNKDDGDVRTVLAHYFPGYRFACVRGRMEGVAIKPSPEGALLIAEAMGLRPDEFLYVGDTGTDMDCGRNAGMTTVGVTWGFRTREELVGHHACHVIDEPAQLLALTQ